MAPAAVKVFAKESVTMRTPSLLRLCRRGRFVLGLGLLVHSSAALAERLLIASDAGVTVIDAQTQTVVATIPITTPCGIAAHGTRAYAEHCGRSEVDVLDVESATVVTTIPAPCCLNRGIAVTPDE